MGTLGDMGSSRIWGSRRCGNAEDMGVPPGVGCLRPLGFQDPQDVGCKWFCGCWGGTWGCSGAAGGPPRFWGDPGPLFHRQEEAERRLPRRRLLLLARHEPVLRWVRDCDHALYQGLVEILVPDVLRPIPSEPPNPPDPPEAPKPSMDPREPPQPGTAPK